MIDPIFSGLPAGLIAMPPAFQAAAVHSAALLAQSERSPMLDPPTRAALLMALLAFVILGLGLIAGAMLAGHWVRRLGGDDLTTPLPLRRPRGDSEDGLQEGAPKPVVGPNWRRSGDTARLDASGAETQVV